MIILFQATLVTSTMNSSTLPLTSTQMPSPNIFPYMFIAFQQRIIRTTVSSSKRLIRQQFLVPIMNFRSFFDAYLVSFSIENVWRESIGASGPS